MKEDIEIIDEIDEIEEVVTLSEKEKEKAPKKKTSKKKEPQLADIVGVGPGAIAKLSDAGVYDLMGLATLTPNQLQVLTGISEAKGRKAIQQAMGMLEMGFISGTETEKREDDLFHITFGSKNLDNLLGGKGLRSKSITEVFGEFGSSKSQMAMMLAVTAQLPVEKGGVDGKVVYIDTEGSMRVSRIKQFAEGMGLDGDEVLSNILTARVYNSSHQMLIMNKITEMIKDGENIKLIIIDSLTNHFRVEYQARGKLADRQQILNRYIHDIQKIADTNNLAVFVTNQVMANPAQMFGDPTKPVGGNIIGHACQRSDSIVVTKDGFKELQDIVVGEYIWGRDKFVKVLAKSKKMIKECKEIRSNNFTIASNEHKFPLMIDNKINDEIVENLKIGDVLVSPEKIITRTNKIRTKIIPSRYCILSKDTAIKIKKKLIGNFKNNIELENATGITIRQLRRIINQSGISSLNVIRNLIEFSLNRKINKNDYELKKTYKHRNITIPKYMDKNLARLYGAWICDGGKTEPTMFKITKDNKIYLEKLNKIVKKSFGIKGKIVKVKDKNAYRLIVNSIEIFGLFKNIDINKIINLEDNILLEFLSSLIDGDGSFRNGNMTFSQKDYKLVTKIQMMLYKFGIKSNINISKKNIYSLYILKYNRHLIEDKLINFEKYTNMSITSRNKKQVNLHPIKSINDIGKEEVYDITVEGEYFLANGIITHNSAYRIYLRKGAKDTRVAKLIDAPELPDNATVFMVEADGFKDIEV